MTKKRTSKRTSQNGPGSRDNRAESRLARASSREPFTAKDAADMKAAWARDAEKYTPEFYAAEAAARQRRMEALYAKYGGKENYLRAKKEHASRGRSVMKPNIDRRELMAMIRAFPEGAEIDEARMTVSFELDQDEREPLDCVLPFHFAVCGTCGGKGSHVNPSIDSHGITASEWEEDYDDEARETYMSGGYDVQCAECGGQRVVPEIDEARADKKCLDAYHEWAEAEQKYAHERAHEQKMGY